MNIRKALKAQPRCSPSKAEIIIGVPPAHSYNLGRAGLGEGVVYGACSGCVVFLRGKVWGIAHGLGQVHWWASAELGVRGLIPDSGCTDVKERLMLLICRVATSSIPKLSHTKTPHNHCTPRTRRSMRIQSLYVQVGVQVGKVGLSWCAHDRCHHLPSRSTPRVGREEHLL